MFSDVNVAMVYHWIFLYSVQEFVHSLFEIFGW